MSTLASQIFGLGGFLEINKISESAMKEFLETHNNEFDKLANEHIKKIISIKGKNDKNEWIRFNKNSKYCKTIN